jgi:hypothetical protein
MPWPGCPGAGLLRESRAPAWCTITTVEELGPIVAAPSSEDGLQFAVLLRPQCTVVLACEGEVLLEPALCAQLWTDRCSPRIWWTSSGQADSSACPSWLAPPRMRCASSRRSTNTHPERRTRPQEAGRGFGPEPHRDVARPQPARAALGRLPVESGCSATACPRAGAPR